MNRNPFSIRYGYHAARWRADRRRKQYGRGRDIDAVGGAEQQRPQLPLDVVYLTGDRMAIEVAVSLRSLIRNAGPPKRITVVSDGSLSQAGVAAIAKGCPQVEIKEIASLVRNDLPSWVLQRLGEGDHWGFKKLALLASLPLERATLFVDPDIVFFAGAASLAEGLGNVACYMQDTMPSFDERLMEPGDPCDPPVNTGLVFQPQAIDWTPALERVARLGESFEPTHFTEQTAAHLALHAAGAEPLDPERFVLQIDDQFEYRDRYARRSGVVCRHYVSTIRHKMWMLPT